MSYATRLKIAIAALFAIAVVGAGIMVVVSIVDTNQVDGENGQLTRTIAPATQSRETHPTSTYSNAADAYRAAIQRMGNIAADPNNAQLSRPYDGALNASTGEFLARYANATELVRSAASLSECDWGEPSMQERLDEQNQVGTMFKLVVLEGRYALGQKNPQRFTDDMLAATALIRQRARKGMITDKMIEAGYEGRAIDVFAAHLAGLPPDAIKQLPQRLDALPKPETGQEMMAAEYAYAQTQKQQNFTMSVMVSSMEEFYKTVGLAMDTQPPAQFSTTVDQEMAKNVANPFVKILAPSLKRIREQIAVADARRAMLRTAVEVLVEGENAIAKSQDPFGAGPFGYVKTAGGFELTSTLSDPTGPVKLVVGQ